MGVNPAAVILLTAPILLIPQVLTVRIPTALTVRTARHLTAVIVQPLIAAMIIQPLVRKPAELGTAQSALCPIRPAARLTAVTALIIQPLALKPEEHGTGAYVRCRIRAVPAV